MRAVALRVHRHSMLVVIRQIDKFTRFGVALDFEGGDRDPVEIILHPQNEHFVLVIQPRRDRALDAQLTGNAVAAAVRRRDGQAGGARRDGILAVHKRGGLHVLTVDPPRQGRTRRGVDIEDFAPEQRVPAAEIVLADDVQIEQVARLDGGHIAPLGGERARGTVAGGARGQRHIRIGGKFNRASAVPHPEARTRDAVPELQGLAGVPADGHLARIAADGRDADSHRCIGAGGVRHGGAEEPLTIRILNTPQV